MDGGKKPLVVGLMVHSTASAVVEASSLADHGADALLVGVPAYYAPSLDTLLRHYDAISRAVSVPLLYYHYPEALRVRLTPLELKELFARVPLAGVENSALSTPELARQVRLLPGGARIFTGLSVNLLDAVGAGAAGAICPLVALMPRTARALLAASAEGDRVAARGHQSRLCAGLPQCLPALGVAPRLMGRIVRSAKRWGLPLPQGAALPHAGVKLALAAQGLIRSAVVRAPQTPLGPEKQRRVLRATADSCELRAGSGARASSVGACLNDVVSPRAEVCAGPATSGSARPAFRVCSAKS